MTTADYGVVAFVVVILSGVVGSILSRNKQLNWMVRALLYGVIALPTALYIGVAKPLDIGYASKQSLFLFFAVYMQQNLWHMIITELLCLFGGPYKQIKESWTGLQKHGFLSILVFCIAAIGSDLSIFSIVCVCIVGMAIGGIRCYLFNDMEYWEKLTTNL